MPLIRDFGFAPGRLPPGPRNTLADLPGVTVGHHTIRSGGHNTGVTVILPRPDIFFHKCTAAAAVINEIIAVYMAKKGFEWAGELHKAEGGSAT